MSDNNYTYVIYFVELCTEMETSWDLISGEVCTVVSGER